jgi:UDP-N-acetylmuramate dehydrogenase
MTRVAQSDRLFARLPKVRGKLLREVALARYTWFRVGGPADILFSPADISDLIEFVKGCPGDIPISVIGLGSNLLIRDGGIRGIVIRLGRNFSDIEVKGTEIVAGAGTPDLKLSHVSAKSGIGGIEFLAGVPGSIGGAVRMNAGAYGREVSDVLISATVLERTGQVTTWSSKQLGLKYRKSLFARDTIVLGAKFCGQQEPIAVITRRIHKIKKAREISQPVRDRTSGSTFINPSGLTAWELIQEAGCSGLRRGDAMVSLKHCNFLVNTGGATSADIEALGEEVRERVRVKTGIHLQWEIERIGSAGMPLANGAW